MKCFQVLCLQRITMHIIKYKVLRTTTMVSGILSLPFSLPPLSLQAPPLPINWWALQMPFSIVILQDPSIILRSVLLNTFAFLSLLTRHIKYCFSNYHSNKSIIYNKIRKRLSLYTRTLYLQQSTAKYVQTRDAFTVMTV